MNIFDKLPKKVALAILLVKALDIREALKVTQQILYLWREFMIKTNITPKIESFKVSFYYRDTYINGVTVTELKDIIKVIEEVKKIESEKDDEQRRKK